MPLSSEGATRTFRQNVALATMLASVAGAVNAVGFHILGRHTSHLTGQVALTGEALARGELSLALAAAALVTAFVLGAATAALLLDLTAAHRGRYTAVLVLETSVLVLSMFSSSPDDAPTLATLLCFAMGLQNGMVTRISGAVVRTTHLTGVLTDFGMECVRVVRWLVASRLRRGSDGRWGTGLGRQLASQLERAGLHVALGASFLGGVTAGSILGASLGKHALVVPALVLLTLAGADWRTSSEHSTASRER